MTNKEKVIKGLKWHIRATKECRFALVDCPYVEDCKTGSLTKLFEDALDLLNSNGVKPIRKDKWHWYCGECGCRIRLKLKSKYCNKCGTKIDWSERIKDENNKVD